MVKCVFFKTSPLCSKSHQSQFSFKKKCILTCVCVHLCTQVRRTQMLEEGIACPGTAVSYPVWQELNPCPLQEQKVLLTTEPPGPQLECYDQDFHVITILVAMTCKTKIKHNLGMMAHACGSGSQLVGRLRQEDYRFEASPSYGMSLGMPGQATS